MLTRMLIGGLRRLASKRTKVDRSERSIQTILIVELTRLGDVLAGVCATRMIRKKYQSAKIVLMVAEPYAKLLQLFRLNVNICGVRNPDSLSGLYQAIKLARSTRADLVCSFSPPKRNVLVTLLSNGKALVGFIAYKNTHTPFLVMNKVESFGCDLESQETFHMENIHDRAPKICRAMGVYEELLTDEIDTANFDAVWMSIQEDHEILAGSFIVIHPFAGWVHRVWPIHWFEEVAKRIVDELGLRVLFVCSEEERSQVQTIEELASTYPHIRVLATSRLEETAAISRNASLVISTDSGPLHLADLLGVPTLGIFGPAPPELTGPRSSRASSLYTRLDCSPCDQLRCVRMEDPCIRRQTPESVFAQVTRLVHPIQTSRFAAHA